jgi:hypothetical protein
LLGESDNFESPGIANEESFPPPIPSFPFGCPGTPVEDTPDATVMEWVKD